VQEVYGGADNRCPPPRLLPTNPKLTGLFPRPLLHSTPATTLNSPHPPAGVDGVTYSKAATGGFQGW